MWLFQCPEFAQELVIAVEQFLVAAKASFQIFVLFSVSILFV